MRNRAILFAAGLLAVVATVTVSATTWSSSARMAEAARTLLQTLDSSERAGVQFALDAPERGRWSNLPVLMAPRPGLMLGDLDDRQRTALHALLRASLSSQGYLKIISVMRLEEVLHELDAQSYANTPEAERTALARAFMETYRYDNYAVAVFGEPGAAKWGWQLTGHHVAANFTVSDGRVSFTPLFLGSSPMVVKSGSYAGSMALPKEGDRGMDLMQSLTDAQRGKAQLSTELVDNIFEGPGRQASLSAYEGIKAAELSAGQKRLLRVLVEEYVRNAEFDAADAQLETISAAGWDELWFSWRGPLDPAGRFYYRVHGPRLLIEYNRQDANHDHMILRDPKNDYGEDWLGRHLREQHPSLEEAMETARQAAASQD